MAELENTPDTIEETTADTAEETAAAEDAVSEPEETAVPEPLSSDLVTGHTAMLWKYLPVPEEAPEPFPEYHVQNLKLPKGEAAGASVRGKKHKHEGSNCDDWFEIAECGDALCIAVADGAGSKPFSRIGARAACTSAVTSVRSYWIALTEEIPAFRDDLRLPMDDAAFLEACQLLAEMLQDSVTEAFQAVEEAFAERSEKPEYVEFLGREPELPDFSSTLLVSLLVPVEEEADEFLVMTCQIGDGMTALVGADESTVKLMGVPDGGEFSGETEFLVSPGMQNREALQLRTKISRGPLRALMMMTDGVADDYFPNETEMLRLYYDLMINGVIPQSVCSEIGWTQEQLRLFKKLPDPLEYPCVNDKSKSVSLQYTKRICSALQISLQEITENPIILSMARRQAEDMEEDAETAERLRIWLDNYVERGSFDDRTLVIVRF